MSLCVSEHILEAESRDFAVRSCTGLSLPFKKLWFGDVLVHRARGDTLSAVYGQMLEQLTIQEARIVMFEIIQMFVYTHILSGV